MNLEKVPEREQNLKGFMKNPEVLVNMLVGNLRFNTNAPINPKIEPAVLALLISETRYRFDLIASFTSQAVAEHSDNINVFEIETTVASVVAGTIWRYPVVSVFNNPEGTTFLKALSSLAPVRNRPKERLDRKLDAWERGVVVGLLIASKYMCITTIADQMMESAGHIESKTYLEQVEPKLVEFFVDYLFLGTEEGDKAFAGRLSTLVSDLLKNPGIFNSHLGPKILAEWQGRGRAFSPFGEQVIGQIVNSVWYASKLEERVKLVLRNFIK